MRKEQFIIFQGLEKKDRILIREMHTLIEDRERKPKRKKKSENVLRRCLHELSKRGYHSGFYGNLWHCFLTDVLVNHENAYSLSCELKHKSINNEMLRKLALQDMVMFKQLFNYRLEELVDRDDEELIGSMTKFAAIPVLGKKYPNRVSEAVCRLAQELAAAPGPEQMLIHLEEFYGTYGVGKLGLHQGFRIEEYDKKEISLTPILNIAGIRLEDLVGYETQKKKLLDNTEAFLAGKRANNCLLFGDAGTGKSSSMKAISNRYYDKGLRIIEVYKHQFQYLNQLIAMIRNRNYKFIIFMDDLSFEDFEIEYKYLKAVIEGGLEEKPSNVLIYATSNRRHLIHERFSDKEGKRDYMHTSDTVQEKLSLAARFGVTIFFSSPSPKEFRMIVTTLAQRYGITMEEEELLEEANKWELAHGGLSGRTAQQFIDYLLGIME